jgi:hypothetical protein
MELGFNLAWFVLALAFTAASLSLVPPARASRLHQLVALALVALILFPVISVTDDLLAAQSPAETDSCARKNHEAASAQSILSAPPAIPASIFIGLPFFQFRPARPNNFAVLAPAHPGLSSVQNRPPPAA